MYSGDAGEVDFLRKMVDSEDDKFSIIVDDGSHVPEHQLLAFNYLFEHGLDWGGKYVIEDIETSYWTNGVLYNNEIGSDLGSINIVNVFKERVDDVNKEFFDPWVESLIESIEFGHNCIIVTKVGLEGEGDRIYRMAGFVDGYKYESNSE